MKVFPIVLGVALLAVTPVIPEGAACEICSCAPKQPPSHARDSSAAVFSGRVVALLDWPVARPDSTFQGSQRHDAELAYLKKAVKRLQVTIEVLEVWKGDIVARTEVYTANQCCVCGFPFELGKEYLIYAGRASSGHLGVSLCSRTRELSKAADDVAALGPGAAPSRPGGRLHPPHD